MSRPDRNLQGKTIAAGKSLLEREEIRLIARNSPYRLTFTLPDGTSFRQKFHQQWALEDHYFDTKNYTVNGNVFFVITARIRTEPEFPDCLLIRLDTSPIGETDL